MERAELQQNIFTPGWLLALIALIGTGMMAVVNWHSDPYIKENERQVLLRALNAVVPAAYYDNDILSDTIELNNKLLLGSDKPTIIYRARKNKSPVAAVLTAIAPNGYSGEIVLLVGINAENKITGVRVVKHKETPGLGDGIEKQRSNWIDIFIGKSSDNPGKDGWKVKRDGGEFDQFTGATITQRAVVGAVHKALLFFEQNKKQIFANTPADSDSNQ